MFLIRLCCAISTLIAFIVGLIIYKRKAMPKYYTFIFLGIISQLMAYIYFVTLETDQSLTSLFSLGCFGEVSSYLFFGAANLKLIPKEDENEKNKLSIAGLIVSLIITIVLIIPIIVSPTIDNYITNGMYLIGVPLCIYECTSVIAKRKKNKYYRGVLVPNILMVIMCGIMSVATAIYLLVNHLFGDVISGYFLFAIASVWMICTILLMFTLKKGLEKWED